MDVATIANFLLFLGAFGASLALDGGDDSSGDGTNPDSLYDSADYSRTDRLGDDDDTVSADADNLAWFTGGGNDDLTGSSGADYADLGAGHDSAAMGAGNDIIEAQDGNDSVTGGNGNDLALGGDGHDRLDGGLDNDSLGGEAGDDWLIGGSGGDILSGGAGNDVISGFSSLGGATASMTGADGADQLFGGLGDDRLILGRGDVATGGAGADRFEMDGRWQDGTGAFVISDYSADEDSLVFHYAPASDPDSSDLVTPEVTVRLSADGQSSLVVIDGSVVAVVEGVTDLQAADITLLADTETDIAYQPEDFDTVLPGGAGDDSATGSAGADYGRMGDGDDTVAAGDGADSVLGEGGDDSLAADAGNDTVAAGDGADTADGGAGNDMVMGEHGADHLTGGAGTDKLWGGAGNDVISGGSADRAGGTAAAIDGADSLSGGDGDDRLLLGRGDFGLGGDGDDSFALDASSNADASAIATIQDYDETTDKIELHYTPVLNASGVEVPPTITVLRGPSDAYAVITFNGEPIAHVTGAADLVLADLVLVRQT